MSTLPHYEVTGDGPPLVLTGSIGSSLAMWEPQLPALADRFRVVRVDHRGHGRSPVPAGPYTIADLGADLLAVLDDLGERTASLCGLSLGGMAGMWVAVHAPERVSALALLATSAYLGPALWEQRIAAVEAGGMAAIVDGAMSRWFTADFRARHPDQVERFAAMLTATPPEGYVRCCAAIRDMDQRADVPMITAPTLIMVGADDVATPPAHARDLAGRIAGARLEEVPDAAHLLNVERPDTVNRHLLEHLGGHADG
jgi:3-oxoadipate enol-lactonase